MDRELDMEPPPSLIARLPHQNSAPIDSVSRPLHPARAMALYIDGDNQSPAIAGDLLASVRDDWGLDASRVVLAGNDHGHALERWAAALSEVIVADAILTLRVPRTPDAADLALILELGAGMERHQRGPDLVVVVSRDELLIHAAEAVRRRGCRVWVAYAQSEIPPARTTLPTLLLPAVNPGHTHTKPASASDKSATPTAMAVPVPESIEAAISSELAALAHAELLAQVRARCRKQPGGGYLTNELGQVLHKLGLTSKAERDRFLKAIPNLRETGSGSAKQLLF